MDDRIARLETTVEQLRSVVLSLQERVGALEAGWSDAAAAGAATFADRAADLGSAGATAAAVPRDPYDPIVILSLIGRLFLVLAGGFFLRAMTEAGIVAVPVGVTSAFVYGLVWLVLADRAGRRRQSTSAIFHALGAALVVFPLLVEATTRFQVLDAAASALVLTALTAVLLLLAWRQRLHAIAWVTLIAALPTSVVLLIKTGAIVFFGFHLIALGIATLLLGYALSWAWLRWPAALVADAVVVGVTLRALSPQHQDVVPAALLLQFALLGAYLAAIAIRTLVRDHNVGTFEVLQTACALVAGFGGATYLTWTAGTLPAALGVASLVTGTACYAAVFALIDRREHREPNVYFFATLALAFVLTGLCLDLPEPWLGAVLAAAGVAAVGLWSRHGRIYLLLHGAAYGVAAGIAAGALGYAARALSTTPSGPWVLPGPWMSVVLIAGGLSAWFAATRPAPEGGVAASVLRLVIVLVLVWVAGGWTIGWIAPVAVRPDDRAIDLGALATLRTGVLAVATLVAAWIGGHARFREWSWLVYPLLVGTGLKMVVQDFNDSRPATLFIALALYGAALIVAPRLKRAGQALRPGAAIS